MQSSNCDHDVMVFDSLNLCLSAGVKMQLSKLIKTSGKTLQIKIANVNKQATHEILATVILKSYCNLHKILKSSLKS